MNLFGNANLLGWFGDTGGGGGGVTGSGTPNTIPLWTGASVLGDSAISQTATAWTNILPATTARAQINLTAGVSPTTPNSGDIWYTTAATTGFNFYSNDGTSNGDIIRFSNAVNTLAIYANQAASLQIYTPTNTDMGFATNNGANSMIVKATGELVFQPRARTSGSINSFTFTNPNSTNQTASTENIAWVLQSGTTQFATGAIATQRNFTISAPTYSFVGSSVITDAYGFYVSAPTAGSNATITNPFAAGFNGSIKIIGGLTLNYVAKTGTYTITDIDYTVDCTSGTFTVTLPSAVGRQGKIFVIKNSGNGIITLNTTSSQTIDAALTQTLTIMVSYTVQSNGANWIII